MELEKIVEQQKLFEFTLRKEGTTYRLYVTPAKSYVNT